jgi:hypothetical protein
MPNFSTSLFNTVINPTYHLTPRHGHRVILFLFCWLVGFVEIFLFMLVGGNKLLLGTCTSLLLLMVFHKLFRLSNGWKELIQQILRTNKREIKLHDGHVALARGQ